MISLFNVTIPTSELHADQCYQYVILHEYYINTVTCKKKTIIIMHTVMGVTVNLGKN